MWKVFVVLTSLAIAPAAFAQPKSGAGSLASSVSIQTKKSAQSQTTGAIKAGVVGATVNRAAKALPKVGKGIVAAGKLGGKVVVGRAVGAVGVLKVEKAY